jgi:hypothetical protein
MLLLAACGEQNSKAKHVFTSQSSGKIAVFGVYFSFKFC